MRDYKVTETETGKQVANVTNPERYSIYGNHHTFYCAGMSVSFDVDDYTVMEY